MPDYYAYAAHVRHALQKEPRSGIATPQRQVDNGQTIEGRRFLPATGSADKDAPSLAVPSMRGISHGPEPPGGSLLRRQGAQVVVLPNDDGDFFEPSRFDRVPAVPKALCALGDPLTRGHLVHDPMILVIYPV